MTHARRFAALTLAAAVSLAGLAASPASADDQEQQIGAQVYQQLEQKGEIIPRPNAMYSVLDPIARRIASVADQQYDYPFRFILVHESSPNAFAVPGGNVYVTDSLLKFVQNKEELAGVLCHETSHDIHHDVVNNAAKNQRTGMIIGVIGALTGMGNSGMGQMGENMAYTLQSNNFSRHVESDADHKGAETCAESGYNPWGMVWLFKNFEKADSGGSMEALSDHPTDDHRIADLETYFRSSPQLFGRFSSNIDTGTPLTANLPAQTQRRRSSPTAAARRTQPFCCGTR